MDLTGQTIGQYRVIEPAGAGGMAAVFKAFQPGLDRYVAIKVLPAQHALTPGFKERFMREAKAVARLSHPNILPIFDVGMDGDLSYFVMKYVPDYTLSRLLGQPLPLPTASRYIDQMAGALDHAHRRGILHRDIKPSNMLVEKEEDWLLLADFGLAKIVESSVILTGAGAIMGTPAYASPEQAGGKPVDHRTDIYSLGIVFYQMVTGRVPYDGETPMGVMVKHLIEPLPMPRSLNPDLPEPVERVILKVLAKEPWDRYERAGDFAAALRQVIGSSASQHAVALPHPPVQAIPVASPAPPAADKSEDTVITGQAAWRQRLPWLGVATVLLLVFIASAIFLIDWGSNGATPSPAPPEDAAALAVAAEDAATQTPPPTVDMDATNAALTEGVFATLTAAAPPATPTPTPAPPVSAGNGTGDTVAPPTPASTATLRPTSTPPLIATAAPAPAVAVNPILYDDFNNPAHDGSYNQSLWAASNPDAGDTRQEDGVLKVVFGGLPNNETGLTAREYDNFKLTGPTFFETRLMSDDVKGNYHVWLVLESDLETQDFSDCIYRGDIVGPEIHCNLSFAQDPVYISPKVPTEFGAWHTVRIEVAPEPMTFTYYVDGQMIGDYNAPNADALRDANFRLKVGVWGPGEETFTGYIDDVRIGPVEASGG
jgi:hypothetical protein